MMNAIHQYHIRKNATHYFQHMQRTFRNTTVVFYSSTFIIRKQNTAWNINYGQVNDKYRINLHVLFSSFYNTEHWTRNSLNFSNYKPFKQTNADLSSTMSGYSPIPTRNTKHWTRNSSNLKPFKPQTLQTLQTLYSSSRSGLSLFVRSTDCWWFHSSTLAWWPESKMSGTFHPL